MHKKKTLTALVSAVAVAAPAASAAAAPAAKPKLKPKKRVVTVKKTLAGPQVDAGQWGPLQVTLVVKKTTTTVGTHKSVKRAIVSLDVPVYPDHTNRSVFINQQALPMLEQEALAANYSGTIDMISGATFTSQAFLQSLQAVLLKAQTA